MRGRRYGYIGVCVRCLVMLLAIALAIYAANKDFSHPWDGDNGDDGDDNSYRPWDDGDDRGHDDKGIRHIKQMLRQR
jgi:hypothetical protein